MRQFLSLSIQRKLGKVFITCALVIASGPLLKAQMAFDWIGAWDSVNDNLPPEKMALDGQRNVYIASRLFTTSEDLDPGPGVTIYTRTKAEAEIFMKVTNDGNFVHATMIEADQKVRTTGLAADSVGNLFVSGYFYDSLYCNLNGVDTAFSTTHNMPAAFDMKLDTAGNIVWLHTYGSIYDNGAAGIGLDKNGNVFVQGYFSDSVQFNPAGPKEFSEIYDMYVIKYDPQGNYQWLYRTNITGHFPVFYPADLDIDINGNINLIGYYMEYNSDSIDFDGGPATVMVPANLYNTAYVVQLSKTGQFKWMKYYRDQSSGNSFSDQGVALVSDANGNINVTGTAQGVNYFDPANPNDSIDFGSNGFFILQLDSTGAYRWVDGFNASITSVPYDITVDGMHNVFFQGSFNGTVDFDPGSGTYNLTQTSGASDDVFLAKYDQAGQFVWAQSYGTSGTDEGRPLVADQYGNVYGACISACYASDSIKLGNQTFYGPHDYIYKLTPCQFELVHPLNDSTLYADVVNSHFQWIDCDNPSNILTADTNRYFTAAVSGNYALVATNYECTDTSACYPLTANPTIGIRNKNVSTHVSVFPNPFANETSIRSSIVLNNAKLTVYNAFGQQVKQIKNISGQAITLTRENLSAGLYYFQLSQGKKIITAGKFIVVD